MGKTVTGIWSRYFNPPCPKMIRVYDTMINNSVKGAWPCKREDKGEMVLIVRLV